MGKASRLRRRDCPAVHFNHKVISTSLKKWPYQILDVDVDVDGDGDGDGDGVFMVTLLINQVRRGSGCGCSSLQGGNKGCCGTYCKGYEGLPIWRGFSVKEVFNWQMPVKTGVGVWKLQTNRWGEHRLFLFKSGVIFSHWWHLYDRVSWSSGILRSSQLSTSWQAFHCTRVASSGGQTILCDGWRVASVLRDSHPELYNLLSTVPIPRLYLQKEALAEAHRTHALHAMTISTATSTTPISTSIAS